MSCDVMTWRHVMSWLLMSCHALKDRLIPTRTVVEKAFLPLWRHHYDVTGSRDVIVDVTIWLPLGTFYRLPIGSNSVSLIVVEIFSLKWRKDDMGALQMFVLKDQMNSDKKCRTRNILKVLWVVTSSLSMASYSYVTSSITWPIDSSWALSYRLPIGSNPLSPIVFEIFSLKWHDVNIDVMSGSTNHAAPAPI